MGDIHRRLCEVFPGPPRRSLLARYGTKLNVDNRILLQHIFKGQEHSRHNTELHSHNNSTECGPRALVPTSRLTPSYRTPYVAVCPVPFSVFYFFFKFPALLDVRYPGALDQRHANYNCSLYPWEVQYTLQLLALSKRSIDIPPFQNILSGPVEMLISLLEGRYELGDRLGSGENCVNYLSTDVFPGVRYAVKPLNKFNVDSSVLKYPEAAHLQREIRLHFLVSVHPNFVYIHSVVDCDEYNISTLF